MYRFLYYRNAKDTQPKVLHDVDLDNQILSGTMTEVLNGVTTLDFTIGISNSLYQQLEPIVGLVKIINIRDNEQVFFGRVLKPLEEMKSNGLYSQRYICEDLLSYFNDSAQPYQKIVNEGLLDFFTRIIDNHNAKVEPHKRFKVGRVTMTTDTDLPYRYIGYQSTFDTLKEQVIDKIGGYVQIRYTSDGMVIDWLKEIGTFVDSPIEVGENIQSAQRETSFEDLITRIIPLGSDKDQDAQEDETEGLTVIRERWDISSVNGGLDYLEDTPLVDQFGIIEQSVDWTEIDDPTILKQRGQQFLDNQRAILTTWDVDAIEKSLIDSRFKKIEVGNTHPIINPPMSGIESLQVVEKRTDFLKPQKVNVTIGADKRTLSGYYLQIQEAQKSIQNVIKSQQEAQKNASQAELNALKAQLLALIGDGEDNEGLIASLEARIAELEASN